MAVRRGVEWAQWLTAVRRGRGEDGLWEWRVCACMRVSGWRGVQAMGCGMRFGRFLTRQLEWWDRSGSRYGGKVVQSSRRTCRLRHGGWAIVGVVVGILVVGCAIWLVSTRSQFRTARTRWDGWFIAEHAVRSGQTEEGREGERERREGPKWRGGWWNSGNRAQEAEEGNSPA